jgi:hypothetical protein
MTNLDAITAQRLIEVAHTGTAVGDAVSRRSRLGAVLSCGIAALVAAMLLAGVYVLPVASGPVALAVSTGYLAGILIAVTIYNVFRSVTPRGWIRRYSLGRMISMGVFFVALALSFLTDTRSPFLWVPLAIASALPLAVLGSKREPQ